MMRFTTSPANMPAGDPIAKIPFFLASVAVKIAFPSKVQIVYLGVAEFGNNGILDNGMKGQDAL